MIIEYITEEGLLDFKVNTESYREYLFDKTNERMVKRLRDRGYLKESNIECPEFKLNTEKDEDGKYVNSDYENVRIIYYLLNGKLSPANAINAKFWAGFSILYCWDYVHFRQEKYFTDEIDTNEILQRFAFTKYQENRNTFVQCVSRLYWAGTLMYDDMKEDHFWVIKELLGQAFPSNMVLISGYNCLNNKNICMGIMDALMFYKEQGFDLKKEHFVNSYKYVDSIGGTMLLDCFGREEVCSMVIESLKSSF